MKSKVFGSLVAGAVAGLFAANIALAEDAKTPKKDAKKPAAAAPAKAAAAADMACANNGCKGKAECKGFGNEGCAGQNACKGHGTLKAKDAAECTKKGGEWKAKG